MQAGNSNKAFLFYSNRRQHCRFIHGFICYKYRATTYSLQYMRIIAATDSFIRRALNPLGEDSSKKPVQENRGEMRARSIDNTEKTKTASQARISTYLEDSLSRRFREYESPEQTACSCFLFVVWAPWTSLPRCWVTARFLPT